MLPEDSEALYRRLEPLSPPFIRDEMNNEQEPEEERDGERGMESKEEDRGDVYIPNLDQFVTDLYTYHATHGMLVMCVKALTNLFMVTISILFFALSTLFVRWQRL